jgi:hypothetical protein
MERFLIWILKPVVRMGTLALRASNKLTQRWRERRALRPETKVKLTCKGCGHQEGHHEGVWWVDRYFWDADDYRLTRGEPIEESTYATREAMEVVEDAPEVRLKQEVENELQK